MIAPPEYDSAAPQRRTSKRKKSAHYTDADLIKRLDRDKYYHLARTPFKISSTPARQLYVYGYNIGGRPSGLWFAAGGDWLSATLTFGNERFPNCCYLYEVVTKKPLRLLNIKSVSNLDKVPNYWINFDFFDVEFPDSVAGKRIRSSKKRIIDLAALHQRSGDANSYRAALLDMGVIFDSAEAAAAGSEFYRDHPAERFAFKDWLWVQSAGALDGVKFSDWSADSPDAHWIWWQTLDVSSGCIWDTANVRLRLAYVKIDIDKWIEV